MRIENGCFELMRWGELLMTQVRAGRRWETNKRPSGIIPVLMVSLTMEIISDYSWNPS